MGSADRRPLLAVFRAPATPSSAWIITIELASARLLALGASGCAIGYVRRADELARVTLPEAAQAIVIAVDRDRAAAAAALQLAASARRSGRIAEVIAPSAVRLIAELRLSNSGTL